MGTRVSRCFSGPGQVSYLDERNSQRFLGHSTSELVADSVDELVGNDKHQ